jgi:hypothetical protein
LNTLDGHASDCITVADKVGRTGVVGFTYGTGPVATYPTSDSDATTQTFCVLLRADMDGLPVAEVPTERNAEYISQNEGRMHACGHDGHMAMLLTAATVITSSEYRARLPANFCVKVRGAMDAPHSRCTSLAHALTLSPHSSCSSPPRRWAAAPST